MRSCEARSHRDRGHAAIVPQQQEEIGHAAQPGTCNRHSASAGRTREAVLARRPEPADAFAIVAEVGKPRSCNLRPHFFGAQTMITKGLKLFGGVGAVGFGMWAMADSLVSSDGSPAVVTGQTAIIRAVQDGYTSLDTFHRGSAVHKGRTIRTLPLSPLRDQH